MQPEIANAHASGDCDPDYCPHPDHQCEDAPAWVLCLGRDVAWDDVTAVAYNPYAEVPTL